MVALTVQEQAFLNMIKPTIMSESLKYKVSPSVIAALGIIESKWGTNKIFSFAKNIYHIRTDSNWYGKCYNDKNNTIYDKKSDCKIIGAILYKVYNSHKEGISDFFLYLLESRRSKDGPLRYSSVFGCIDYKEFINKLVRAGFMQYFLNKNDDVVYTQNIISIIEKYELYLWDMSLIESIKMEEEMSKKKNKNRSPQILSNITTVEEDNTVVGAEEYNNTELENQTLETFSHIYRVRLDWEKPDTQIFSSPIYNDAKEVATKHEGYKIYIDDDGVLFEDPWIKVETIENEDTKNPSIKHVIQPIPGKIINLENKAIYKTAISRTPYTYISGKFVFFDYTVSNKRAKIITKENFDSNRNVNNIIGWIIIE